MLQLLGSSEPIFEKFLFGVILLSVVYMKTFVSQIMAFVFLVFSSVSVFIKD